MAGRSARAGAAGKGRFALGLLLLLAIVFRAAIPAGWMPNLAAAGGAPLVICTADGGEIHSDGAPAKPASTGRHELCVFSSLASASAPPGVELGEPSFFAVVTARDQRADAAPRSTPRYREQAARAPPALV